MPNFIIEYEDTEEGEYRLIADQEEGPWVGFGQVATVILESKIYYSIIKEPSVDTPRVFELDKGKPAGTAAYQVEEGDGAEPEEANG